MALSMAQKYHFIKQRTGNRKGSFQSKRKTNYSILAELPVVARDKKATTEEVMTPCAAQSSFGSVMAMGNSRLTIQMAVFT